MLLHSHPANVCNRRRCSSRFSVDVHLEPGNSILAAHNNRHFDRRDCWRQRVLVRRGKNPVCNQQRVRGRDFGPFFFVRTLTDQTKDVQNAVSLLRMSARSDSIQIVFGKFKIRFPTGNQLNRPLSFLVFGVRSFF